MSVLRGVQRGPVLRDDPTMQDNLRWLLHDDVRMHSPDADDWLSVRSIRFSVPVLRGMQSWRVLNGLGVSRESGAACAVRMRSRAGRSQPSWPIVHERLRVVLRWPGVRRQPVRRA